jgi:membrane-associated protein
MGLISFAIDFLLHMDEYLDVIIQSTGIWTYLILFLVIFIETGLVVTPFLPGDSLLFATGALAATTILDPVVCFFLLATAAIVGDTVNYSIGHYIGPRVFSMNVRWLKKEYLYKTQAFYDKHGGKTIFLARFIPIIRTFAPFVAGVGQMRYGYFITYNLVGGITWTALMIFCGYFFGNLPIVRDNFSIVIIAIIIISVMPAVIEYFRERKKPAATPDPTVKPVVESD